MISMQRTLGQPVMVPPGNTAARTSPGVARGAQLAAHIGNDVMDVRIRLDGHELIDLHGARFADPPQVVALQVDQHHVLGALLGMSVQLASEIDVGIGSLSSRTRARNGARRHHAVAHRDQALGRRADDGDAIEPHDAAEGRRIGLAQALIEMLRRDARDSAGPARRATNWLGRYRRRQCIPARARRCART